MDWKQMYEKEFAAHKRTREAYISLKKYADALGDLVAKTAQEALERAEEHAETLKKLAAEAKATSP